MDPGAIEREVAEYFLTSARCACFKQAARSLNTRVAVLRKQLRLLEERLGGPLFVYRQNILRLTLKGQRLQALLSANLHTPVLPKTDRAAAPVVRLMAADALLHDLVLRDLLAFVRRNAAVRLDLQVSCEPHAGQRPADIMLWLAEPGSPRPDPGFATTTPVALARIGYQACVAKRYSREAALPSQARHLDDYMLVQVHEYLQVAALEPWNQLVRQRPTGVTQVHSHELALELIRRGACVGVLPAYIPTLDNNLVALPGLFPQKMERNAWLSTHALAAGRPEVQALVALIRQAFDERQDWF
ncbi:LysR family transcriptional regulator [Pseudomonas chlororaphis]|uniref:LysR family transcriptional regulator n=1 Tax=Pseudomonas chlororaphis TaxID=587753 RepID=UPI00164C9165|nr:LysR family transcriptional regulator [Pseudomonas chlororaphis]